MHCSLPGCQFEGAEDGRTDTRYCQQCGKAAIVDCLRYRDCDHGNVCGLVVGKDSYCRKFGNLYRYTAAGLPYVVSPIPRYDDNAQSLPELFDLRASSGDPLWRTALSALPTSPIRILYPNQRPRDAQGGRESLNGREVQCFTNTARIRTVRLRHDRLYALMDDGNIGVAELSPSSGAQTLPTAGYWNWYRLPNHADEATLFEVGDTVVVVVQDDYIFGFDASYGARESQNRAEAEPLFQFDGPILSDSRIALCGDALLLIGKTQKDSIQVYLYSLTRLVEGYRDTLWEHTLGWAQHQDITLPTDILARPQAFYFFHPVTKNLVALRHNLYRQPVSQEAAQNSVRIDTIYSNKPVANVHSFTLGENYGVVIAEADPENNVSRLIEFRLSDEVQIPKTTELKNIIPNPGVGWCGLCGPNDDLLLMDRDAVVHRFQRSNPNKPVQSWTPFQNVTAADELQLPLIAATAGRSYLIVGRINTDPTTFRSPQYRIIALDKPSSDLDTSTVVGVRGGDGVFKAGIMIRFGFAGNEAYFIDCSRGDAIVQRLA